MFLARKFHLFNDLCWWFLCWSGRTCINFGWCIVSTKFNKFTWTVHCCDTWRWWRIGDSWWTHHIQQGFLNNIINQLCNILPSSLSSLVPMAQPNSMFYSPVPKSMLYNLPPSCHSPWKYYPWHSTLYYPILYLPLLDPNSTTRPDYLTSENIVFSNF